MGYYITTWGSLKVTPEMGEGQKKLWNHFAKKLSDCGGHWEIKDEIEWEDEIGKSYPDKETLRILIECYIKSWAYRVDGEIEYRGESYCDEGGISVVNNCVREI